MRSNNDMQFSRQPTAMSKKGSLPDSGSEDGLVSLLEEQKMIAINRFPVRPEPPKPIVMKKDIILDRPTKKYVPMAGSYIRNKQVHFRNKRKLPSHEARRSSQGSLEPRIEYPSSQVTIFRPIPKIDALISEDQSQNLAAPEPSRNSVDHSNTAAVSSSILRPLTSKEQVAHQH